MNKVDPQTIRDIQIQLDQVGHELTRLRHIEDRAADKIQQLESLSYDPDCGVSEADRNAYIRALKFVLGQG